MTSTFQGLRAKDHLEKLKNLQDEGIETLIKVVEISLMKSRMAMDCRFEHDPGHGTLMLAV
ncbi:MAG: hypothetical protein LWX51_10395 [Deltaproteobacteria bacterium]|nr:hypothetical protein [Deltaproteobacteria bacterium]